MLDSVNQKRIYLRVIQTLKIAIPIWILIYIGNIAFYKSLFLLEYIYFLSFPGALIAGIIAVFKGNIHAIDSFDLWVGHVLFYFSVIYIFICNSKRFKKKIEEQISKIV